MGHLDPQFTSAYSSYLRENVDVEEITSIAWLGWSKHNEVSVYIESLYPNLKRSELFDIEVSDRATYWDINKEWNISGFDLVLCFRTSVFARNSEHFIDQLSCAVKNNKHVIFDFILPEMQFLRDVPYIFREYLKGVFNLDPNIEAGLSWGKFDYWFSVIDEKEEDDLNTQKYEYTGARQPDPEYLIQRQKNFGKSAQAKPFIRTVYTNEYYLLPILERVYSQQFPLQSSQEFNLNKLFLAPRTSFKEVLTEKRMMEQAGLFLENPELSYVYNFRPWALEEIALFDRQEISVSEFENPKDIDKRYVTIAKISRVK